MAKIDKRKKYIMVVDTETANSLEYPVVYDLGIAITDKTGKIYESYSFVISDVYDIPGLMETAYYKEKIATNYEPGLASGKYRKGLKNPFGYDIMLLEIDKGVVILWQKKKKN